ncbi:MAG: hypothetical protein EHM39_09375, partial [Chloroflexi bacterium]
FVVVEIEDDGVGFDVSAVDANYDQRGSLGMVNMRERAELVEGTLRIQSAPGRGTKITILLPIHGIGKPGSGTEDGVAPPLHLQSQRTASRSAASPAAAPPAAPPPSTKPSGSPPATPSP